MTRRDVIQSLGLVSTHALFPSILAGFVASCTNAVQEDYTPLFFTPEEFELIREVIDIILPATSTASASKVNTHYFLDEVFAKCLNVGQQALIRTGLQALAPKMSSTADQKVLLMDIDQKAFAGNKGAAYFKIIKQYTLVGFFTSQEGMTKAANYVKIPGDYQGEIPLDENTLNYGKTNLQFYL